MSIHCDQHFTYIYFTSIFCIHSLLYSTTCHQSAQSKNSNNTSSKQQHLLLPLLLLQKQFCRLVNLFSYIVTKILIFYIHSSLYAGTFDNPTQNNSSNNTSSKQQHLLHLFSRQTSIEVNI